MKYADKLTDEEIRTLISPLEPNLTGLEVSRQGNDVLVTADVMLEDEDGSMFPATSSFSFDDYHFECSDYDADDHRYELRRMLLAKFGVAYAEEYLLGY